MRQGRMCQRAELRMTEVFSSPGWMDSDAGSYTAVEGKVAFTIWSSFHMCVTPQRTWKSLVWGTS